MAIGGDYSVPSYVNGYACWNCTQVAEAQKNINPADPKAGPFGVDAKNDPTANQASGQTSVQTSTQTPGQTPAVQFGGLLAGITPNQGSGAPQLTWATSAIGGQLNISA